MAEHLSDETSEQGRFPPGKSGNPAGMTKEQREARDAVKRILCTTLRQKGISAYERLLDADNPLIVRDWADRVLGKVKEQVELSQDPDNPVNALTAFGPEDLAAFALWRIEKRREGK